MARSERHNHQGHDGPARSGQEHRQAKTGLDTAQQAALNGLLARISEIAQALRAAPANDRQALAAGLDPVATAAEPVAVAFAQQLGAMRGPGARDAIEVAQAVGELDPREEVAREARRARLRLRSTGVMPSLTFAAAPAGQSSHSPITASGATETTTTETQPGLSGLPRLTEAFVSQAREQGELLLILGWQEGQDANYVRGHSFLLDFWEEGVKGFTLMDPMTRASFEREINDMLRGERGERGEADSAIAKIPVNWAQARRLVLEALDVNAWRNTQPNADFQRYRPQITARLLGEPTTDELRTQLAAEDMRAAREGDRPYIGRKMTAEETLVNWLGAWTFGDFGLAYDLLADDHPLRRQQSREEYIALRRQWWEAAQPAGLRVTLVREQEKRASALWVPGSAGVIGSERKELEAFWSIVLQEAEIGGQLEELPMATLSSKETGRHWYWTGYTVAHDRQSDHWYISRSRDEGANSQALKLEELQQRIQEAHQRVEQITAQEPPEPGSEAAAEALRAITGALTASLHYSDALIVRLPLDETIYRSAINDARTLGNHERAAALIERMRGRFADDIRIRFEQGIEEYLVAEQYGRQGLAQAESTWLERAVQTLTAVVEAEPTAEHLQGLGELLSRQGHFNQAETRLREAIEKDPTRALVYSDLADTLMGRITGENLDDPVSLTEEEQQQIAKQALAALGEAGKLDRSIPGLYTRMGAIYDLLKQPDDARIALEEAVRLDPADADAHYTLGAMLMDHQRYEDALPHFVTAVQLAPLALQARLSLAACYGTLGRMPEANRELDTLDRLQPGLPQVAELRSYLAQQRKKH
jgi:tetratricopeptide (TPR) repeat protein